MIRCLRLLFYLLYVVCFSKIQNNHSFLLLNIDIIRFYVLVGDPAQVTKPFRRQKLAENHFNCLLGNNWDVLGLCSHGHDVVVQRHPADQLLYYALSVLAVDECLVEIREPEMRDDA